MTGIKKPWKIVSSKAFVLAAGEGFEPSQTDPESEFFLMVYYYNCVQALILLAFAFITLNYFQ